MIEPSAAERASLPDATRKYIAALEAQRELAFAANANQHRTDLHPYTCGNDSNHRPLIHCGYEWRCADCEYRQPVSARDSSPSDDPPSTSTFFP